MATFTRVDAGDLTPGDPILTWYERAVTAMQAKPATDPESWSYQAAMHKTVVVPAMALWNECRHRGWYFLPWHRGYLYYFERIVRAEIIRSGGPADWALPYWNYEGGGTKNQLPVDFQGPVGSLFVPGRALSGTMGLSPSVTTSKFAMSRTAFTGTAEFGGGVTNSIIKFASDTGLLEATPHNDVHSAIGGMMSNAALAALDPIFWLHHSNIDRLWWEWQSTHADPTTAAWLSASFSYFDTGVPVATLVSKATRDMLDTDAQLDYTYLVPAPPAPFAPPSAPRAVLWPAPWPTPTGQADRARSVTSPESVAVMIGANSGRVRLTGNPVRARVAINSRAMRTLATALPNTLRQDRAYLRIENVEAERNPPIVYGVYVNLPDVPSEEAVDQLHVGNVSLFGIEGTDSPNGGPHAMSFDMEITTALNWLAAHDQWQRGDNVDVTFQPLPNEPDSNTSARAAIVVDTQHEDTPIDIGRISIYYA